MENTPVMEYNRLYHEMTEAEKAENTDSVYDKLMQRSDRVLDAINRVVEVEQEKLYDKRHKLSLHNLVYNVFKTLNDVFYELQNEKDLLRVPSILFQERRSLYLGVFLLFLGVVLFILVEA